MVSLESRAQMPAWKGEVDEAEHEGIVRGQRLGAEGDCRRERRRHRPQGARAASRSSTKMAASIPAFSDEEKIIPCDSVILAIGQQADLSFLSGEEGVQVTPRGILKIDENLMTTAPGVFAGGDVAFGPRVLVEAVANGHRAARSIHVYPQRQDQEDRAAAASASCPTGRCRAAFSPLRGRRCPCWRPTAASASPKWNWALTRNRAAPKGCAASTAR